MTRNQLLVAICPSSRTHDCEKYCCFDCNKELIRYLNEYDRQIKSEAIEEYKNALLKLIKDEQDTRYGYLNERDIREVAEQLIKSPHTLV